MVSTQGRVSQSHSRFDFFSLFTMCVARLHLVRGWLDKRRGFVVCAVVTNSSLHKKTKNKNKIIHWLICKSVSAVLKCFPHTIKIWSIASPPVRSEAALTLFFSFFFFLLFFSPCCGLASTYIAACRQLTSVLLCGVAAHVGVSGVTKAHHARFTPGVKPAYADLTPLRQICYSPTPFL